MSNSFFSFKYQAKFHRNSLDEILAIFLNTRNETITKKDLIWTPTQAYWLPMAMQKANQYSDQDLKRCGLSCIFLLEQQVSRICLTTNLVPPRYTNSTPNPAADFHKASNPNQQPFANPNFNQIKF